MQAALAIRVLLAAAGQSFAAGPLRECCRMALGLCGPTNVVVGQLDSQVRYCVQGTLRQSSHAAAAVEVRDATGHVVWRDAFRQADLDFAPGAYVHWLDGQGIGQPLVVYAFCPDANGHRGGARFLRASDGALVCQIGNRTRFGNNNSLVGDLDGDGKPEFVYADQKTLVCYDLPACTARWQAVPGVLFCWSLPALLELNADGRLAIVFGSAYNNADGSSSMVALDHAGRQIWRSDRHAEDLGSTPVFWADVDGDGRRELLKVGLDLVHRRGQQWNHLYVFDAKGTLKKRIRLGFTGIAVGDMDGDGLGELAVVVDGEPGQLVLYGTRAATTRRQWPTPFGNAARTGTLGAQPGERGTSVP